MGGRAEAPTRPWRDQTLATAKEAHERPTARRYTNVRCGAGSPPPPSCPWEDTWPEVSKYRGADAHAVGTHVPRQRAGNGPTESAPRVHSGWGPANEPPRPIHRRPPGPAGALRTRAPRVPILHYGSKAGISPPTFSCGRDGWRALGSPRNRCKTGPAPSGPPPHLPTNLSGVPVKAAAVPLGTAGPLGCCRSPGGHSTERTRRTQARTVPWTHTRGTVGCAQGRMLGEAPQHERRGACSDPQVLPGLLPAPRALAQPAHKAGGRAGQGQLPGDAGRKPQGGTKEAPRRHQGSPRSASEGGESGKGRLLPAACPARGIGAFDQRPPDRLGVGGACWDCGPAAHRAVGRPPGPAEGLQRTGQGPPGSPSLSPSPALMASKTTF